MVIINTIIVIATAYPVYFNDIHKSLSFHSKANIRSQRATDATAATSPSHASVQRDASQSVLRLHSVDLSDQIPCLINSKPVDHAPGCACIRKALPWIVEWASLLLCSSTLDSPNRHSDGRILIVIIGHPVALLWEATPPHSVSQQRASPSLRQEVCQVAARVSCELAKSDVLLLLRHSAWCVFCKKRIENQR